LIFFSQEEDLWFMYIN